MSRVVRNSRPSSRQKKECRVRSKSFAKTVGAQAGEKICSFLGQNPTTTHFYVRVKGGKVTIGRGPMGRSAKSARVAPAGFFKQLYTREYVAEENALAASSVIDLGDL